MFTCNNICYQQFSDISKSSKNNNEATFKKISNSMIVLDWVKENFGTLVFREEFDIQEEYKILM